MDRYFQTGDLVYIGEPFGDAVELTKDQYDRLTNPDIYQKWEDFKASIAHLTDNKKREKLYGYLRYHLTEDQYIGSLDINRPFYGTFTVDEMSERAVQYLGDNQDIVVATLAGKAEAKAYIRSLF